MDIINLVEEQLDVNSIYSKVVEHSTGAVSLFVGTTRNNFEGKKVISLEYEAFKPMACKEIKKICENIREKWKVKHIAFHHRLGEVPVGEASVVIAVSSEHRAESLEAVQFGIDALKKSVPIWKKELYSDGAPEWKANKECLWTNQEEDASLSKKRKIMVDYAAADCVQIKASNLELGKRITAFMERKRSESDVFNVQEFCHRLPLNELENSCARTEAVLVSRKDSKSHLKVSRCVNMWGPQTHSEVPAPSSVNTKLNPTPAIQERLQNMEKHLGFNSREQPIPLDVYGRLKALEDRILHLESISPEYFDGPFNLQNNKEDEDLISKIEQKMDELRRKLV
ncbi:molybdopterin synthase catalytic subunit-like [Daphnia pulex]|uniref:molybdopterin synthase catalytic subunit-like n=1 Tax=Daphnia pulex TaxID=6669 RepID=UPI001EDE8042|nr:molybdopterin synthase catalytic subunit-like [Daphnia pulex]XP_046458270.1 molybdopterin synthase catalytic subunit-like [Daphnia pulex]